MIRILNVLTSVIACENDEARRNILLHHADLVWMDAQRDIGNAADLAAVGHRYATLRRTLAHGVLGAIGAIGV